MESWINIRARFQALPSLESCPNCFCQMVKKKREKTPYAVKATKGYTIPYVSTNIYFCLMCNWWALRELMYELECNAVSDEIICAPFSSIECEGMPITLLHGYLDQLVWAPWSKYFEPEVLERISHPISKELAISLFGEKAVIEMWGEENS